MSAPPLARLTASPSPFPLDFDEPADRVLCIPLSEDEFRAASFLDERLIAGGAAGSWIDSADAARATAALAGESDFIFHIGHVGSTLVSRLLGASERVFSLREPAILRTLARRHAPMPLGGGTSGTALGFRLEMALKLLARVWRPSQRALIKATSFVSEIGPHMLAVSPSSRALLMFVSPQTHIATRLGGPASRAELPAVAAQWLERLHRRLGATYWRLETMSPGERAALGWVCEICALASVAQRFGPRVQWMDFQAFLADPQGGLADALTFLRGSASEGEVAGMLRGGDLGRYAKAPEFAFDAETRAQVIEESERENAAEIARGIAWINKVANGHPVIGQAARAPALAVRGDGRAPN